MKKIVLALASLVLCSSLFASPPQTGPPKAPAKTQIQKKETPVRGLKLKATAHSATLSWTASVSTVAGYNPYRSTVSGGPYTKLTAAPVTALTYVDTVVVSGTTYFYVVTAVTSSGVESVYSAQVSGTVPVVAGLPTITTQPVSVSVTAGQTATFSVGASGTAPLTYQWSVGDVAISGATSTSYTTPATTAANSGTSYSVVVTDSAGNVTSSAATLTVTPVVTTGLPAVGNRISVLTVANIRATSVAGGFGTLLGTEPAGALGTVVAIGAVGVAGTNGYTWIQILFDSCSTSIPNCTGWMGSNNMTIVTTPPPPVPTLTETCVNTTTTRVCTYTETNQPGVSLTSTGTAGGKTATVTGTMP
jgi:fibronectin type 3 domain-containing protein